MGLRSMSLCGKITEVSESPISKDFKFFSREPFIQTCNGASLSKAALSLNFDGRVSFSAIFKVVFFCFNSSVIVE